MFIRFTILQMDVVMEIDDLTRRRHVHAMRLGQMPQFGAVPLLHDGDTGLVISVNLKMDARQ